MTRLTFGFSALIVGFVVLVPGCGDDENGGAGGTSGAATAGSGGASSGGTPSTGGTTGNAGTADPGAGAPAAVEGGSSAGGAPAVVGGAPAVVGGAPGAGFMNPEGCPDTAPATNDDCSVELALDENCQYPGSRCVCNGYLGGGGAGGAGMAGNWICQGDGTDCPEAAPATDDNCDQNGLMCPYPGDINCFCAASNWSCDDPVQGQAGAGNTPDECPAVEPTDAEACVGGIYGCLYEGTLCNCPGAGPNADEWNCSQL